MGNKYYTPDISEFYIGFEYEKSKFYKGEVTENFSTKKYEPSDFIEVDGEFFLQEYIDSGYIRVKYLYKQDIEELGFEHTGGSLVKNTLDEFTMDYNDPRGTYDKISILYNYNSKWCLIIQGDYETPYTDWPTRFTGHIKNKSELKQILKMLNIL